MSQPTLGNAVQRILNRIDVQFRRDRTWDELAETWQDAEPLPDRALVEATYQTLLDEYAAQLAQQQQQQEQRQQEVAVLIGAGADQRIAQINTALGIVDTATTTQVRTILRGLLEINRDMLRALKWLADQQ